MLYKDLTTEQQERLQEVFQSYKGFPEDATHIDKDTGFDAVVLKYIDGVEHHYFYHQGWKETCNTCFYATNIFKIPSDFCRKTGKVLSQKPPEDVSNATNTNTQDSLKNVSESLTDAFKTIRELCTDKDISLSFTNLGDVEIHTIYGDYDLDMSREDLEDVVSKMADTHKIIKGEV